MNMKKGLTILELMIVVSIIAILAVAGLVNYTSQIKKGNDAKRKKDLDQLRLVLEDYYNDNNRYPALLNCGDELSPWLKNIPCEPGGKKSYLYETNAGGSYFRIYTRLENEEDRTIDQVGCSGGCGPGGDYNYGVTSGNIDL